MPTVSTTTELKKARIPLHYYGQLQERRPPLIFVHGAGRNGAQWKSQLLGITSACAPLAIDLPGHGRSGGEAQNRVSAYREYLKDFLESSGISSAILCGHSMGGAIVLDYALRYPEDTRALILVSTGSRLRVAPHILESFRAGKNVPNLSRHLYGPDAPEELIQEGEAQLAQVPAAVSYADYSACDAFDVTECLPEIKLPVLVLCGEQDAMTPPKYSRFLAEKIPGARLELLPTGGHMLMQEKGDQVNRAIERFLQEKGILSQPG